MLTLLAVGIKTVGTVAAAAAAGFIAGYAFRGFIHGKLIALGKFYQARIDEGYQLAKKL